MLVAVLVVASLVVASLVVALLVMVFPNPKSNDDAEAELSKKGFGLIGVGMSDGTALPNVKTR